MKSFVEQVQRGEAGRGGQPGAVQQELVAWSAAGRTGAIAGVCPARPGRRHTSGPYKVSVLISTKSEICFQAAGHQD